MSTPTHPLNSRPGGPSAKNAHRAGAPNTQPSGENPMVGTDPNTHRPAGGNAAAAARDHQGNGAPFVLCEDEVAALMEAAARHTAVYHERAALWELLKAQTRIARDLRSRAAHWQAEARQHRMHADRQDRDVRAALGAPGVGGSCVEWAAHLRAERDDAVRECEQRETEILDLIGDRDLAEAERDKALARVAELESTLARAGEPR